VNSRENGEFTMQNLELKREGETSAYF